MARFFNSLFGRAGKEEPSQPIPMIASEYDPEYVMYCIEKDQIITALEENLHTSDDPKEIAIQTLKVACSFYGADWAGILEIDVELDVWNPLWWFNLGPHDETYTLFKEFEIAKFMPNWIQALETGKPIMIPNAKEVQKVYPEEYEVYRRLRVNSVIGVPFGPNPVGFLAIRNPTRYAKYSSMMRELAYVLHRAMAQQQSIDSSNMALAPDEIKSDRDIIVNFFGSMEIKTSKGVLEERNFPSPRACRVATFLLLNRKSSFTPWEIASALWPDDPDKTETISTYIRGYIHKFRKEFKLVSPYQLIKTATNGYQINHDFHIMTDLQQFDQLCQAAQHTITVTQKVDYLKQAVALYRGHVYENACDEHWIVGTVTHYKSKYIGIMNELLVTLMNAGDYTGVQQYANRAIELTPENVKAHYYLIFAMTKLETYELAKNQINLSKGLLTTEEFDSLKKLIMLEDQLPYSSLMEE